MAKQTKAEEVGNGREVGKSRQAASKTHRQTNTGKEDMQKQPGSR